MSVIVEFTKYTRELLRSDTKLAGWLSTRSAAEGDARFRGQPRWPHTQAGATAQPRGLLLSEAQAGFRVLRRGLDEQPHAVVGSAVQRGNSRTRTPSRELRKCAAIAAVSEEAPVFRRIRLAEISKLATDTAGVRE